MNGEILMDSFQISILKFQIRLQVELKARKDQEKLRKDREKLKNDWKAKSETMASLIL